MQLYALNDTGLRFFVADGEKGCDYFCIECGERVRVRAGLQRSSHFYHVFPKGACRQAGKSAEHIQLQAQILDAIGHDLCEQEVRFNEIGRIADVAWFAKKIIFEIQCSPISKEEVEARCHDYAKLGWYVVWILLDRTFLKRKVSDVLLFLETRTHYFASAEESCIYDLFSWHERGLRRYPSQSLQRFVVPLAHLCERELQSVEGLPNFLAKRIACWEYTAPNDLIWQHSQGAFDAELLQSCSEKTVNRLRSFFYAFWHFTVESALAHRLSK